MTLSDDVPSELIVRRAGVLRPLNAVGGAIKSVVRPARPAAPTLSAGESTATANAPAKVDEALGDPGLLRRAAAQARALGDLLLAIPDRQIGWFFPAVRAAQTLVRVHQPEVIFSSSPPASSHLVAVALRRLTGLPLVIDFRDPWARTHWRAGGRHPFRDRVQQRLERLCVRAADRVVLNTAELREEFVSYYNSENRDKFVVVPNGYDPEVIAKVQQLRSNQHAVADPHTIRVCHPGTVYGRRDLRPVIGAIARLAKSGHRVILEQVGDVEDPGAILRSAEQHGVRDQVVLSGFLPHREMLARLAAADVLLVLQPGTSIQVPGKLFEMLPFRRPLLAITEPTGSTAAIVRDYELGAVAGPDDEQAIAAAVIRLIERPASEALGDGWHAAMDVFDGRAQAGELGAIFTSCLPRTADRHPTRSMATPAAEPRVPAETS